jgi:hypothetical protein
MKGEDGGVINYGESESNQEESSLNEKENKKK